jgi:small GTP-binding protein
MSFSVGIVGFPNVGKSTLFKALTRNKVDIAPYPFTTVNPNYGVVRVPDQRLEKIAEIIKPEKITPTVIEFVDIAGLVRGAHKGEGLGNQFLAQIRNCDAVVQIVRGFANEKVENVLGEVNPQEESEVVKVELLMKDLETLKGSIEKAENDSKKDAKSLKKLELLKRIKEAVSQGKGIGEINLNDEERAEIKEYQFLTQKPVLYVLNDGEKTGGRIPEKFALVLDLRDEEGISELSEQERKELSAEPRLDELIKSCYNILDLITFFTVAGGKETRAWTIKKGGTAIEAAGIVHTDFKEKFIRAEVIPWQELATAGSWAAAREKGQLKTVGREYLVQDGDVIEFKI